MANRIGGSRFGFGRRRRVQARPITLERGARAGRGGPRFEMRTWLGWLAAVAGIAVVAFLVGRAGSEVELATPTPMQSQGPLIITFGTALDPQSGEAIQLTDRFRAGDTFAYSVHLSAAPGVTKIFVRIMRLETDKTTVVQPPSRQGIAATSSVIAFTVKTTTLLKAWGEGDYQMDMFLPGAVHPFATGRFTLVATPTAS